MTEAPQGRVLEVATPRSRHLIVRQGLADRGRTIQAVIILDLLAAAGLHIVRLNAEKIEGERYSVRFSVAIPERSRSACLATVANTAEGLQLECSVAVVSAET